jgi:hypothetical protein
VAQPFLAVRLFSVLARFLVHAKKTDGGVGSLDPPFAKGKGAKSGAPSSSDDLRLLWDRRAQALRVAQGKQECLCHISTPVTQLIVVTTSWLIVTGLLFWLCYNLLLLITQEL